MPLVFLIHCDSCDLRLPESIGGYMYVLDKAGNRVPCPHPLEWDTIQRVTGSDWASAAAKGLLGFVSLCLCFTCASHFELDVERDVKRCPACSSLDVRTANASKGAVCPRCQKGILTANTTGVA